MAELLTTKEILAALDNIIKKAEKYICIFTYNIKIDPNYLTRLRNASKRNVKITVVFGVDNGDDKIIEELLSFQNCTVYFKDYLHAKFYYNEKELLVGSMNLSEASAKNNFELGVLFRGDEYLSAIRKVKEEAKEIISDSKEWKDLINRRQVPTSNLVYKTNFETNKSKNSASCIRCNKSIKYNPDKPFCSDCFHEWAEWENETYAETYCHHCSKNKENISFAKPECYSCYSSN